MRVTLEDLRVYYGERQGDRFSVVGVAALAIFLVFLARLTGNQVLAMVAFVNFAFLWVPLGSLWHKQRLRERWKSLGLDSELLRHCEALTKVDWSLDEYVDTVLSVYTTIHELSHRSLWRHNQAELTGHLATVRRGLLAFFQRVQRVDELRQLYDRCAESLRNPGRLAALQARVDRQYRMLERFADAFERALLDFSEALAAAMGSGDEAVMNKQLAEFASGMRQLTASLDDVGAIDEFLTDELDLDAGARFDRLLAADDVLAETLGELPTAQRLTGEEGEAEATAQRLRDSDQA